MSIASNCELYYETPVPPPFIAVNFWHTLALRDGYKLKLKSRPTRFASSSRDAPYMNVPPYHTEGASLASSGWYCSRACPHASL